MAAKHKLGGEKKLWASRVPAVQLGTVYLAGDGSGVWTADPIATLDTNGNDLVAKVDTELKSATAALLTVVGTDQNGALLSGTATFSPPSWSRNKFFDFQEGYALDITPNGTGLRFKTITAVAVANAKMGSRLNLFKMPDVSDWQYIEKVDSVEANVGISPGVPIPDGLDGASEVTRGRSNVPSVSIKGLHRSAADGMIRFAGSQGCLRMEVWAQGKLAVERHVFANVIFEANENFGDGSNLAEQGVSGMYEDVFFFVAP